MKNLAMKISELKKENYDKKIFTPEEIGQKTNPETSRNLKLCEEFGIDTTIIVSELIHTKDELAELKGKTTSFRESGSNDEKIAELEELVSELEAAMREKHHQAQKMKAYKAKEDAHGEALAALEPLADKLKDIEKELKDNFADIQVLQSSVFENTINPETFRLMDAMSRPSGVFN